MEQFGPSIEFLEIEKSLRGQGLGSMLLREVERVTAEHFPPILPFGEVVLQLSE
jgi:hypothetical protein